MREIDREALRGDWFDRWWNREGDLFVHEPLKLKPVPPDIAKEFGAVTDLGIFDVKYADRGVMRRVQLFACRNFRGF